MKLARLGKYDQKGLHQAEVWVNLTVKCNIESPFLRC